MTATMEIRDLASVEEIDKRSLSSRRGGYLCLPWVAAPAIWGVNLPAIPALTIPGVSLPGTVIAGGGDGLDPGFSPKH